ncbi:MAG: hypothetical protein Q8R49_01900 [Rhodoferax sp.]|nr:hypothetical protein [Rhodoferax sp.]
MSKEKTTSNSRKRKSAKVSVPNADSQIAAGGELHQIAGGETLMELFTQLFGSLLVFIYHFSSVPTLFRGERTDWARNPDLNLLRMA